MLTLDAVRAAVLSDQPWTRLDELVRAEQATGRKVKEIYGDLAGIADEIDATPGLTEDGSDAFGDTLDALTGMCHRDCQYKDPPNTTLPSEEEIAKLPRWARVAFALRCARRVFPLLDTEWARANPAYRAQLSNAIEYTILATEWGRGDEARLKRIAEDLSGIPAPSVPAAVIAATKVAVWSVIDLKTPFGLAASHATAAYETGDLRPFIRRDFDHLARLAEWQHWTDETPVPPEVFGPMWPEGPPMGWPPITHMRRTELPLALFPQERVVAQVIEDDIVNLFNALNRYHIARSGVRLTLEQFQSLLPAFMPVEV